MNIEQFANEIRNRNDLMVTLKNGKLTIKAFEVEMNCELEEVSANLQFIDNLVGKRVDECTIIVTEL